MAGSKEVALAGLLHDVGKFSQRVANEQRWRHDAFTEQFLYAFRDKLGEGADRIVELAATSHQQVTDRLQLCVKLADWLAAAERQRGEQPQIAPERTALLAISSRTQLDKDLPEPHFFPLKRLSLTEEAFFPVTERTVKPGDYQNLWDEFANTLRQLPSPLPFSVWQTLLQVFTHAIPAATPWEKEPEKRTVPNISLFHHAKLTAAIAACLASLPETMLPTSDLEHLRDLLRQFEAPDFLERLRQDEVAARKPLCVLVRGDVAGIQKWLYRIARAEGEAHRRTAKRLRGRSFYLVLLTEAIAYWLCRKADLPPCNVLFCGGGAFDVLLPAHLEKQLHEWERKLDQWLLEEFHGDLRVNLAWVPLTAADFYHYRATIDRLVAALERRKRRPVRHLLDDDGFWFHPVADICRFCDTSPFTEPAEPCEQCKQQEQLGNALRRVGKLDYLVWAVGDAQHSLHAVAEKEEPVVKFEGLDCSSAIVSEESAKRLVQRWDGQGELIIRKRNDLERWWQPLTWDKSKPVQAGIWWAATDAPVAKHDWQAPTKAQDDPDAVVCAGEALDFDEIAALSTGDALLGVLRMDVDRLGALFALGIEPPSPSRVAELSGRIDAFFTAWLLQRCRLVTGEWQKSLPDHDKRKDLVDNAFYLVYAGGDDVMVVGPWDLTLKLAQRIRNDFDRYCGCNLNLTISAGIVFVKPKFPIHRFAALSGDALEQAKERGRNRITAFNATVTWDIYAEALAFGEALREGVTSGEVPRTFLHFLWRLYRNHKDGQDPMWVPLLHYTVARRLEPETVERLNLLKRVPALISERALPIALGYAILATRERAGAEMPSGG